MADWLTLTAFTATKEKSAESLKVAGSATGRERYRGEAVGANSKVEPLVPGRTSLVSDNSSVVHVDEHIFRVEMIGEINRSSTWGNRQAEAVGLSAFSRAKVRTALGQRSRGDYGLHLESERSGFGEVFGWEQAFEPHILDIVCSEDFTGWFPALPDKVCQPLPAKFEVYRLIVYCLRLAPE